jgi:hypothetical protein
MSWTIAALGLALVSPPALAGPKTTSGTSSGISWKASNHIVAVGSTATIEGGGNPAYLAQTPQYRGVVGLVMEYASGAAFVCSGSLLNDRKSVLTAGHCVSDGYGTAGPEKVTAFFYDGNPADPQFYQEYLFGEPAPGVTPIDVDNVFVNAGYTGEVIDQNDIAVLRLSDLAPAFATSYDLYSGGLIGEEFNIAGYGGRSDGGGDVGVNLGTGRLRQADNRFDYAWGDPAFDGLFTSPDPACGGGTNWFCGDADIDFSYIADFDNGLLRNDTACLVAVFVGGAPPSGQFCDQGLGFMEGTSAGGDSGGPEFIDGQIAAVTSYGLSFGAFYGDIDDELNDTFGEFGGYVPVAEHLGFIQFAMTVPEPATWLQMIAGLGLLGAAMRRRPALVAAVA